jgi:hypothetical protein
MGEMNKSDDPDERMRVIAREVMAEKEPHATARISLREVRNIAKWLYIEFTGIGFIIIGIVTAVSGLAIPTIFLGEPIMNAMLVNTMIGLIIIGLSTLLIGFFLQYYSKKKSRELSKRHR